MIPWLLPRNYQVLRLACEALADFNWTKNSLNQKSLSPISTYTLGEVGIQNSSLSMEKEYVMALCEIMTSFLVLPRFLLTFDHKSIINNLLKIQNYLPSLPAWDASFLAQNGFLLSVNFVS